MAFDSCTSEKMLGLDQNTQQHRPTYRAVLAFRTLRIDPTTASSWLIGAGVHGLYLFKRALLVINEVRRVSSLFSLLWCCRGGGCCWNSGKVESDNERLYVSQEDI